MSPAAAALMTPRILVVDDERQIHASLRLRLGRDYDLVFCFDAREALEKLQHSTFDLCFADIHMPRMDGLTFIEEARAKDPALGYVVLSAFDTDENLRRTIPLNVYDFVPKPLPEKAEFESRIPQWIEETRRRRREQSLAHQAQTIASDFESARLERDVELVASETARDALRQTANLLTTIHAHLVSATTLIGSRGKMDAAGGQAGRNLEEARKTAEAAMNVAEGFFDSSYGSRYSSPALINDGILHAIGIATRMSRADEANKAIDFTRAAAPLPVQGLTGIEFLLMLVPALGAALSSATADSTIGIQVDHCARLETVVRDPALRGYLWLNRRHALSSHAGALITITASSARPLLRPEIEAWLKSEYAPLAAVTPRGLIAGIQKSRGLLAISTAPEADHLRLVLALPT